MGVGGMKVLYRGAIYAEQPLVLVHACLGWGYKEAVSALKRVGKAFLCSS